MVSNNKKKLKGQEFSKIVIKGVENQESYSLSQMVLPYGYLESGNCPRQLSYRVERRLIK